MTPRPEATQNVRDEEPVAAPPVSSETFNRRAAGWRAWVRADPNSEFPAAKGRYHLYVADACPWASRVMMVRELKGLQDVISVTRVLPTWRKTLADPKDSHAGWVFADPLAAEDAAEYANPAGQGGPFPASMPGCEPDPVFTAFSVREIYERCGDEVGLYSVPLLFDLKKMTIVSNESSEIVRMLNSEFNAFAKHPELDLYPEDMRDSIDSVNEWIYSNLNNGVYRCGFCKSQAAYDAAIADLTTAFDRVNSILSRQRFIAGDCFTEADIRLFVTLVRFDEIYSVYFKCNTRSVSASSALLNYCREIYQMSGMAATVNMPQIKQHYYTSHPSNNFYAVVPRGPDFCAQLSERHDRWKVSVGLSYLQKLLARYLPFV